MSLVVLCSFTFLLALASEATAKLPPFVKPCKRSDPKLNECVADSGFFIIPHVLLGKPKYGIPVLDPLEIDQFSIRQGSSSVGLELVATNCKLYGLGKNKDVKAIMNLKERKIDFDYHNDEGYDILANYTASGKVLVLPISGNGPLNITMSKVKTHVTLNYELIQKKGKEYMNVTKMLLTNDIGDMKIKIDNLFNGDKTLGDNMNLFMNENWKVLAEDVEPLVSKALSDVTLKVMSIITSLAPFNEFFPQ